MIGVCVPGWVFRNNGDSTDVVSQGGVNAEMSVWNKYRLLASLLMFIINKVIGVSRWENKWKIQ